MDPKNQFRNFSPISHNFKPPFKLQLICGYLYFIKGGGMSSATNFALIYDKLSPIAPIH